MSATRRSDRRERGIALFLGAVGVGAWLHWSVTDPSFDLTEEQTRWNYVLAFSALVLGLMGGAAVLGRTLDDSVLVGGCAWRSSFAGALAPVTNIVEDGLGVEEAFLAFIVLTGVELVLLLSLGLALTVKVRGRRRVLALAPLLTAAGVLLYVDAGGPILLATWLATGLGLVLTRE